MIGSVLSPGVRVEKGAPVINSILFHRCLRSSAGARVSLTIADKAVSIGAGRAGGRRPSRGVCPAGAAGRRSPCWARSAASRPGARVDAGERGRPRRRSGCDGMNATLDDATATDCDPAPARLAMILAGGVGSRLNVLVRHRAKPAVPFGGIYRLIDFPLSNVMNSGIERVGILTQYLPYSLTDHIGNGHTWGLVGRAARGAHPAAAPGDARERLVPGHGRRDLPQPELHPPARSRAGA